MKTKLLYWPIIIVTVGFAACDDDETKSIPTVTTLEATDVTTSSAAVSGVVVDDGNSKVKEIGIAFSSIVGVPTTADNKVKFSGTETDFSVMLEGLNSGTTYHVRAYAINDIGTGYGEVMDFTTGNAAPVVSDILITGELEMDKEVTASYTYTDSEGDLEGESIFQWYVADDATGSGESAIAGATAKTYRIGEEQTGKFIRVSITPKAATGTTVGTEVESSFAGAVGEATTVTFIYNGEEITYGIINSTTGEKWLDRNLGAARVAQSASDYQAYGDMFQWGRLADGHQRIDRVGVNASDMTAVNGVTSATAPYETSSTDVPGTNKFIIDKSLNGDWRDPQNSNLWQGVNGVNNPCPAGWRIPTQAEWIAEGMASISDAYTKLKITYSGFRPVESGDFTATTESGYYWTSTIEEAYAPQLFSFWVGFDQTSFTSEIANRGYAFPCRCIKD